MIQAPPKPKTSENKAADRFGAIATWIFGMIIILFIAALLIELGLRVIFWAWPS